MTFKNSKLIKLDKLKRKLVSWIIDLRKLLSTVALRGKDKEI